VLCKKTFFNALATGRVASNLELSLSCQHETYYCSLCVDGFTMVRTSDRRRFDSRGMTCERTRYEMHYQVTKKRIKTSFCRWSLSRVFQGSRDSSPERRKSYNLQHDADHEIFSHLRTDIRTVLVRLQTANCPISIRKLKRLGVFGEMFDACLHDERRMIISAQASAFLLPIILQVV
jgi:hypothetical protein